jgi:glycosyltransferase involved in cell wall biosynthesis
MNSLEPWMAFVRRIAFDLSRAQARHVTGAMLLLLAYACRLMRARRSAVIHAMACHRWTGSARALRIVANDLASPRPIMPNLVSTGVGIEEAARRSIVIRWPQLSATSIERKGIMVIAFTRTFAWFLRQADLLRLTDYFHVVLEPSWSGYLDADILAWSVATDRRVYVQSSETRDQAALAALCSNLTPVTFGASDWVDYRRFTPMHCDKLYDAVYVANTHPVKRVHAYFRTIRKVIHRDPSFRALIVCAGFGDRQREIELLRSWYGIEKHCDAFYDIAQSELNRLLNQCKFNVLLSMKEGSNRSLFESMFAGLPVVLLDANVGVNKSYINEHTGVLAPEARLAEVFLWMARHHHSFRPRAWALEHIAPEVTTTKLCTLIDHHETTADSRVPAGPTHIKVNNPEMEYFELGLTRIELHELQMKLLAAFERPIGVEKTHVEFAQCLQSLMDLSTRVERARMSGTSVTP